MSKVNFEPGTLLVAHPGLTDPAFGQSVILVLARGEDDGVIGANIAGNPLKGRLFEGGPMEAPLPLLLHETKENATTSRPLGDTGYAVTALFPTEDGRFEPAGLIAKKLDKSMFLLGYAGWGAGQLENEAQMGVWTPTKLSLDELMKTPSAERWARAATEAGLIAPEATAAAKPSDKPPTP